LPESPEKARARPRRGQPLHIADGCEPCTDEPEATRADLEFVELSLGHAGLVILRAVLKDESSQTDQSERELLVPAEIRNVSFPSARRGYDRGAVDAYVKDVNRLIAELEVGRSPQAAVRHALDRVAGQVGGILQRARETAEEIIASAREEADETTARAKAEAAALVGDARAEADRVGAEAEELLANASGEADDILARSRAEAAERLQRAENEVAALREQADARMRELHADTEAVWEQRGELLEDLRGMTARFEEVARAAAARFPREPAEQAEQVRLEAEAEAETEPSAIAATDEPTDEPSAAMPAGRVLPRR
jgi:DivIVA domain-containing protein